jgi:hypothetical protein
MNDLIEALTIMAKYATPALPTHCEHDVLTVMVDPALVSEEDLARLDKLGFIPGGEWSDEVFSSYFFGSA